MRKCNTKSAPKHGVQVFFMPWTQVRNNANLRALIQTDQVPPVRGQLEVDVSAMVSRIGDSMIAALSA